MIQLDAVIPMRAEGPMPEGELAAQDSGAKAFEAQLGELLAALSVEGEPTEANLGDAEDLADQAAEETILQLALAAGEALESRSAASTDGIVETAQGIAETAGRIAESAGRIAESVGKIPEAGRIAEAAGQIAATIDGEAGEPLPLAPPGRPASPSSPLASQTPAQPDVQQAVQTPTRAGVAPAGTEVAATTDPANPASIAQPASAAASRLAGEARAVVDPAPPRQDRRVDVADRAVQNRPDESAAEATRGAAESSRRLELYAPYTDASLRDAANDARTGAAGRAVVDTSAGPVIGPNAEATRLDAVARDSGIPTPVPARAIPEHVAMMATSGGGTARLRLHPANLGEVEITVVLRGGAVDVVMRAEEPGAEIALLAQRDTLGESLGSRELRMENFDVLSRNGSSSDPNNAFRESGQSGQEGRQGHPDAPRRSLVQRGEAIASPGNETTPSAPAQNRGIDLRI